MQNDPDLTVQRIFYKIRAILWCVTHVFLYATAERALFIVSDSMPTAKNRCSGLTSGTQADIANITKENYTTSKLHKKRIRKFCLFYFKIS